MSEPRRRPWERLVYLECACSSQEDIVRLRLCEPDPEQPYPDMFIDGLWGRPEPLWKRIRAAVGYVVRGHGCRFVGGFEHIVTPESAEKMAALLAEFRALAPPPVPDTARGGGK